MGIARLLESSPGFPDVPPSRDAEQTILLSKASIWRPVVFPQQNPQADDRNYGQKNARPARISDIRKLSVSYAPTQFIVRRQPGSPREIKCIATESLSLPLFHYWSSSSLPCTPVFCSK
jgi:hypothetical protein